MLSIHRHRHRTLPSPGVVLLCVLVLLAIGATGCAGGDVDPNATITDALALDSDTGGEIPTYTGGIEVPDWPITPPAVRTEGEVCQVWSEAQPTATTVLISGTGECEAGQLTESARRDGMYRINFYRWLVGMPLLSEATPLLDGVQECAAYQGRNEIPISHDPPTDQACFTEAAAEYAKKSNLAAGLSLPGDGVDLFMEEAGHRALLLSPGLGATALGYFAGVLCQLMFDENWTWTFPVHRTIAYPGAGPNPQPPTRMITVHPATGHTYDNETRVHVIQGGAAVMPAVRTVETGFGTTMFEVTLDRVPDPGERVQVDIESIATQAGRTNESYTFWFVECP